MSWPAITRYLSLWSGDRVLRELWQPFSVPEKETPMSTHDTGLATSF